MLTVGKKRPLISINPIDVLLWTFRRNEHDVVNLYNCLSPIMQLATSGNMLNFGYWHSHTKNPSDAQKELCSVVGKLSDLDSASRIIDVGSGFSAPAMQWKSSYSFLDIICVNINLQQLKTSTYTDSSIEYDKAVSLCKTCEISFVNATSTKLPIAKNSADRIIALESAQHFKPVNEFIRESRRILTKNGLLIIAIPVTTRSNGLRSLMKLGILSLTWSSEHYRLNSLISTITKEGFKIKEVQQIGSYVYEPLANYYIQNRDHLKNMISSQYPSYLENILYKSLLKMKDASQKKIIDYALIKCSLS